MPINLTTTYPMPTPGRIFFGNFTFSDVTQTVSVPVELWSLVANNSFICRVVMTIQNGVSTRLDRQLAPPLGLSADNPLRYFIITTRSTPNGYNDACAVVGAAANNPAARKAAMEAWMLSYAHLDPVTLAGAVVP